MSIKYKLREKNMLPRGKEKVYFTCHPEDFDLYFESLTDKILEKQNCAIWYYGKNENGIIEESNLEDLEEMQLFVIPVTRKFLQTSNRALEQEYQFALDHHIPVLPIMMSAGLEDVFLEKCGNLQYLDPNAKDDTAISFDEKIEKRLSSVLIGDEMASRIREAFDAYIFMSYRKKDRKYAQELMRFIHNNSMCRDIAIWYDEYLTPGNDFNNEIGSALNKSQLFALVVTPNLLEINNETGEPNYVARVEYPMAIDSGKNILPVEMQETNREKLSEMYPNISKVVSITNEDMLNNSLLSVAEELEIKEDNRSAEHDFLIGLAYLGGIDVEVDYERALSLIISAAENGFEEAIEKLVNMYQTGEGVSYDYKESTKWRKRLVELSEQKYKENQTDDNRETLLNRMYELGNDEIKLNHLSEAEFIFKKMVDCCNQVSNVEGLVETYRKIALSCGRLGDIEFKLKNYNKAKNYYVEALKIFRNQLKENALTGFRRDVALVYIRLGNIEVALNNYDEARDYYNKAIELHVGILKELQDINSLDDLASSYVRLADLEKAVNYYEKAKFYYEKVLDIRKTIHMEKPSKETSLRLAIAYEKLGDLEKTVSHNKEAKNYYVKAIELMKWLNLNYPSRDNRHILMRILGSYYILETKLLF